jgi:hypothetical protein
VEKMMVLGALLVPFQLPLAYVKKPRELVTVTSICTNRMARQLMEKVAKCAAGEHVTAQGLGGWDQFVELLSMASLY